MKNRKLLAVILAVAVLLTFAFVLSACGEDNNAKPVDDTTQKVEETDPVDPNPPVEEAELNVSFDETATYAMDDEAIIDALSAEIISGGVSRRVEVSIKSLALTDDGQYIKVIVSAEGIDKEIFLPFETEPEVYVREELKPLYELLKKDGDKAFKFEFIVGSVAAEGDTPKTFSLKVILNKTAEGLEFAVADTSEVDVTGIEVESVDKALVIYKNGTLNVCGFDIELPESAGEVLDGEALVIPADSIDKFFESLSEILDTCDRAAETPMISTMIGFTKANGIYNISTDTQKLLAVAQLLLSGNENLGFDVNEVIDLIDAQFDGAVKSGDIKINLSLAIDGDGINLGVALQNDRTGASCGLTVDLAVADEAFEIPEATQPDIKDIEIEIPFALPQGKLGLNAKIVVHTSQIITASDKDYVTGTLTLNGKEGAANFVLNDQYIYLDASALTGVQPTTFYKAFEIDGEPVSLFRYLTETLFNQDEYEIVEDFDSDNGDDESNDLEVDYDNEDYEGEFSYSGYGCTTVDENGVAMLSIGATEEELRSQILFYIYDEEDNQIFIDDYQLNGFDSSVSFHDYVDILFYDIETSIEVVVRDAAAERCDGINIYPFKVGKGTDVATAQHYIPVEVEMTDGQVYWMIYDGECTIDKVDGVDVDEGYVFELIGNYTLTVTYKATGEQTEAALYVFDPDNLLVEYVEFTPEIYVDQGTTEEELRNYISLRVEYDNGDFIYIEDYEIVDFTPGDEFVNICWDGNYYTIGIVYYEPYNPYGPDDDQPSGFDIADLVNYLRVTDILASEDPIAAIKGLIEQNKELFKSVFVVDKENKTLRVVINSKNGGDLVDVINIFFGIPGEEGFTDIDENYLLAYIDSMQFDVRTMFDMLVGVDLADFLADLYFDAGVSLEDGIAVNFDLCNGGEVKYLVIGCSVKAVDASVSDFELTDAEIAEANDFETLPMTLLAVLLQILLS